MRGIVLAEQGHFVNALPAKDITGGATSDVISMKNFRKACIIVSFGVSASAATKIFLEAVDNFAGANPVALPYSLYAEETSLGDTLGAREAVTAAGKTPSANDNIFYVIELDAMELPDDKPFFQVRISAPAAAILASVVVVLGGARFGGSDNGITAIA